MTERESWRLLLKDFKLAAEDAKHVYALTDAWSAYIDQREAEVERIKGELCALQDAARAVLDGAPMGYHMLASDYEWHERLRALQRVLPARALADEVSR